MSKGAELLESCKEYMQEKVEIFKCNALIRSQGYLEMQIYKCICCEYRTKSRGSLERHMLSHKDASELATFKCTACEYQTKYRRAIISHLLRTKIFQKCKRIKCQMSANIRRNTREPLEIPLARPQRYFRSGITKHRRCLMKHLLRHKDISEVQMFKCKMCKYQTKYKNALKATR
ncbi:hypothetical protein NQ317_010809 [Molorchus minor]|uniref:C2H2-type domain-containing protein n=1 Tax=Molorchus minor TaxID=1323400 RepID=A0ABQ9IRM4_9CUCU|nr:hypothetical protein NQ317_010809 [Molorchus minor]